MWCCVILSLLLFVIVVNIDIKSLWYDAMLYIQYRSIPTKQCMFKYTSCVIPQMHVCTLVAVLCGPPPSVLQSTSTGDGVHYSHTVTYDCLTGYAFNPTATLSGDTVITSVEIECSYNGSWIVDGEGVWDPIDCQRECPPTSSKGQAVYLPVGLLCPLVAEIAKICSATSSAYSHVMSLPIVSITLVQYSELGIYQTD